MNFNALGILVTAMECWIHIVGRKVHNFNKFRLFKLVVFCMGVERESGAVILYRFRVFVFTMESSV